MLKRELDNNTIRYLIGSETKLTLEMEETEQGVVITLIGELVSGAARWMQDDLNEFASIGVPMILDFSKVTYMANAIQTKLLDIQQNVETKGRGALVLRNLPAGIRKRFEETGVIDCLEIDG